MGHETDWSEGRSEKLDRQAQRCYWRRLAMWVVATGILLYALAGVVRNVRADEARSVDGQVALERLQGPCDDAEILAHITRMGGGHLLAQFKKAILIYDGRGWRSCWIEIDGYVFSVDEEGAPFQPIPAAAFRDKGA